MKLSILLLVYEILVAPLFLNTLLLLDDLFCDGLLFFGFFSLGLLLSGLRDAFRTLKVRTWLIWVQLSVGKVDVWAIFVRHGQGGARVRPRENLIDPLLLMEAPLSFPGFEDFLLPLNDSLLPPGVSGETRIAILLVEGVVVADGRLLGILHLLFDVILMGSLGHDLRCFRSLRREAPLG